MSADQELFDAMATGLAKAEDSMKPLGCHDWKVALVARHPTNPKAFMVVGTRGDEDFQEKIGHLVEGGDEDLPKSRPGMVNLSAAVNHLVSFCHGSSKDAGWWNEVTPETVPVKLCLVHSEVSEAMEGYRKDLMDDKLPHRKMIEVELADVIIRVADLAGHLGLDLGGAIAEKMSFNKVRPDHKLENRAKKGGKKF